MLIHYVLVVITFPVLAALLVFLIVLYSVYFSAFPVIPKHSFAVATQTTSSKLYATQAY